MTAENFRPITEQKIKGASAREDETGIEELLETLQIPASSLLEGWRDNYLENLLKIKAALKEEIAKMPEGKGKETKKLELAELEEDIREVQAEATRLEKYVEKEKQTE
ncbi:MAG: hypothetical protein EOM23_01040 [Candidatus Moranbacteria bacterium]|nr:hypothetical protein [Candidatus Moranbacteria bacterium]